jgi:hypothetical protein
MGSIFTDRNTWVLILYLVSETVVLMLGMVERSALDFCIHSSFAEA